MAIMTKPNQCIQIPTQFFLNFRRRLIYSIYTILLLFDNERFSVSVKTEDGDPSVYFYSFSCSAVQYPGGRQQVVCRLPPSTLSVVH